MIKKNTQLLGNARFLRRNMTRQENHLWYDYLRHYPIKIYKQRIIDNFVVDFYCHQARLVIELDGSQHYSMDGKEHDKIRTEIIGQYEIQVLRFSNKDIDEKFDGVCCMIDRVIKERLKSNVRR